MMWAVFSTKMNYIKSTVNYKMRKYWTERCGTNNSERKKNSQKLKSRRAKKKTWIADTETSWEITTVALSRFVATLCSQSDSNRKGNSAGVIFRCKMHLFSGVKRFTCISYFPFHLRIHIIYTYTQGTRYHIISMNSCSPAISVYTNFFLLSLFNLFIRMNIFGFRKVFGNA